LHLKVETATHLFISDLLGKIRLCVFLFPGLHTIDLSSFSKGVYILTTDSETPAAKIIKW
ncbi:MAG: T9SS type A sorting domain-containing protein, partial [Bacteroidales bacterium]